MIPKSTLDAVLNMILLIAGPFLFAMFLVYCIAGVKKDYSATVCPEGEQYDYMDMHRIYKEYSALYDDFVEKNCLPPPTEKLPGGTDTFKQSVVAILMDVPTTSYDPEFAAVCTGFIDGNAILAPRVCLEYGGLSGEQFLRTFHVVSHCSDIDSSHCRHQFINSSKFLDNEWGALVTQADAAKNKDALADVVAPVRACQKKKGGNIMIYDCSALVRQELVVWHLALTTAGATVLSQDVIYVLPSCKESETGTVCFVHGSCDKIRSGIVMTKAGAYVGNIRTDTCKPVKDYPEDGGGVLDYIRKKLRDYFG